MRTRLLPLLPVLLCLACASTPRVVSLSGREESLADMRGQVLVVNVWETWCKPCVEEMPLLLQLAEELEPQGVRLLAVNRSATVDEVLKLHAFVERQPASLKRRVYLGNGSFTQEYGTRAVPATYVLDRQGRVVATVVGVERREGQASVESIRQAVLEALGPAPSAGVQIGQAD